MGTDFREGIRMRYRMLAGLLILLISGLTGVKAHAAEVTTRHVRQALEAGCKYLLNQQRPDGSFPADEILTHPVAVTCLATLALRELPLTGAEGAIARAEAFLRQINGRELPTHELALLILAGIDAENEQDRLWLTELVAELQERQLSDGSWWQQREGSNVETGLRISYLAVLALREAAWAGYPVQAETWRKVQIYWRNSQNEDGSWGTKFERPLLQQENNHLSLAGRTRQALGTLAICRQMLQHQAAVEGGAERCCQMLPIDFAEQKGHDWLTAELARWTKQQRGQNFLQYHLYALEKTGEQLGIQWSDEQDWYEAGTLAILQQQNRRQGYWEGNNRIVATSYSLLFLTKAIKPVLAQKWRYASASSKTTPPASGSSPLPVRKHSQDLLALTQFLTKLPEWPAVLNCQELQLQGKDVSLGLQQLLQAPVLYVSGDGPIVASPSEVEMLQEYLQLGGVIIASPVCQSADFELSFQKLIRQISPDGGELEPLADSHPVYWMEFPLGDKNFELYGLETGCRTAVFYCPQDLGCAWELSQIRRHKIQQEQGTATVEKSTAVDQSILALQLGANLIAYATSRHVSNRFERVDSEESQADILLTIPRGAVQVAELQLFTPLVPQGQKEQLLLSPATSLKNMVEAANRSAEIALFVHPYQVSMREKELFRYPVVYCHGAQAIRMTAVEKQQLRAYLEQGGILFCDACCGSEEFDHSFRTLMQELFPDSPLQAVPQESALFSGELGFDLQQVEFRGWEYDPNQKKLLSHVQKVSPVIEGILVNDVYSVFYSRYDLSCALEAPGRISCEGYTPESALKIATNVLMYSLLQ